MEGAPRQSSHVVQHVPESCLATRCDAMRQDKMVGDKMVGAMTGVYDETRRKSRPRIAEKQDGENCRLPLLFKHEQDQRVHGQIPPTRAQKSTTISTLITHSHVAISSRTTPLSRTTTLN